MVAAYRQAIELEPGVGLDLDQVHEQVAHLGSELLIPQQGHRPGGNHCQGPAIKREAQGSLGGKHELLFAAFSFHRGGHQGVVFIAGMGQAPVAVPQAHRLLPGGKNLASQQQGGRQGPHQQASLDHQQGTPCDDAGKGELAHQGAKGLVLAAEVVGDHALPGQLLLALLIAQQELAAQAVRLDQINRAHQLGLVAEPLQLQPVVLLADPLVVASEGQGPQQVNHKGDHGHDAHAAGNQEQHQHKQQREHQVDRRGERLQGTLIAQQVDAVEPLEVGGRRSTQVIAQAHLREVRQSLKAPLVL